MAHKNMKFIYNNIQSYSTKKMILNNYIENSNISCWLLVETKAHEDTTISYRDYDVLKLTGSKIGRNVRGGSAVMAHREMRITKQNSPKMNFPTNECLHFSLPFRGDHLHILLTYIHPVCMIDPTLLIKASTYKYCILIGDFNIN